jgi:hypothetical protein
MVVKQEESEDARNSALQDPRGKVKAKLLKAQFQKVFACGLSERHLKPISVLLGD